MRMLALTLALSLVAARAAACLAPDVIRDVIHAHYGELSACYTRSLAASAPQSEPVRAHLVIDIAADGHVLEARLEPGTHDAHLDTCIVGSVQNWMFPANGRGGHILVHYPLVFSAP